MAKPIIGSLLPFDASGDRIISFTYTGNQPYKNRIIVYNAQDLSVVFDNVSNTMQLRHLIPAGTLVNGIRYAIEIQCFDKDGEASSISDKSFVWCLSTPTFQFSNITDGETLNTGSPEVSLSYYQEEGDVISQYQFFIYNAQKNLLGNSEIMYGSNLSNYVYKGLDNLTSYYVRATGVTKKGIMVDTGYYQIFIQYQNPTTYSKIYAESDDNGIVSYRTNFTVIEPSRMDGYDFQNGFLMLEEDSLLYDKDFNLNGDFTIAIKFRYPNYDKVLRCYNETDEFNLSVVPTGDGLTRYKLTVKNILSDYILYSEPIEADLWDVVTVYIRRINNIYGLKIFKTDGTQFDNNWWFSRTMPIDESALALEDWWLDIDRDTTRIDKNDIVMFYRQDEPTDAETNNVWISYGKDGV